MPTLLRYRATLPSSDGTHYAGGAPLRLARPSPGLRPPSPGGRGEILLPLAAIFPVGSIGLLQAITWLSSATSTASSLVDYGVSTDIDLRTFDDGWNAENAAHAISNNLYDNRL